MSFFVLTSGEAWLEIDGEAPVHIRAGSLSLIPHAVAHAVRSAPTVAVVPLGDLPVEHLSDSYDVLRHGGGGAATQAMYCVVSIDHLAGTRLVAQLPTLIHVDGFDQEAAAWLQSTLSLIVRESLEPRPGGETVITRLADVLVIHAIRSWLDSADEAKVGWLAALPDPHLSRALSAFARSPEQAWTVGAMAREARMSRSGFSAKFTAMTGESPMQYATDWRMQLARRYLGETARPLSAIAVQCGYQSEAAFSRAYKRTFGVAPGATRRLARVDDYGVGVRASY